MWIPFLGRLRASEWPALIFSLLLVTLESMIAFITFLLPSPVIALCDVLASWAFSIVPSGFYKYEHQANTPEFKTLVTRINQAYDFVQLCELHGYTAEEHVVRTQDGYMLGLHRISPQKNGHQPNGQVVYLHHGLLMNSDIWMVGIDKSQCLPLVLVDMGYDVWLGNNRGNKYSKKHVTRSPLDNDFWSFSIDEFALFDIPQSIDYVLQWTKQTSLSYIGFSQGSAQAFASLSIHPSLNEKINLFVALAPAMSPPGLNNKIVDSLMKASPSLVYLFFGKRRIISSTTFWQAIIYPPLFVQVLDFFMGFLFDWKASHISFPQKLAAYSHLYSYSSVKSVVHWFQIMRARRFQMFDDDVQTPDQFRSKHSYKVVPYPTKNIQAPILLLYGTGDSLVDIQLMLSELPESTAHIGVDGYEHIEMLWGDKVHTLVFPYIAKALSAVS